MTLKKLQEELEQVIRLIESIPEAPAPDHPDLEGWVTQADGALNEVYEMVERLLG